MPTRIVGSPWNDILKGTDATEAIYGLAGDDTIIASRGADVIDGGPGSDTVDYSAYTGGISVWLAGTTQVTARGSLGETQTLSSIENLKLDSGNDVIQGDDSDNSFWGNAGNDTFICSGGIDHYDGGSGFDTVDYTKAGIAITVKFSSAQNASISTSGVVSDRLVSIEKIIGSAYGDTFYGSSAGNTFFGGAGNDRFFFSAGNDTFNGGSATDTADYSQAGVGIVVQKGASGSYAVNKGASGKDTLVSIENIKGSRYKDTIDGSSSNNVLDGGYGNDRLYGEAGNDTLIGGRGNDIISGGAGSDTFVFGNGDGMDTITDFTACGSGADLLDVRGIATFSSYQGMYQHHSVYQSGNDVVLDFAKGDEIVLKNVALANLTASDFRFA